MDGCMISAVSTNLPIYRPSFDSPDLAIGAFSHRFDLPLSSRLATGFSTNIRYLSDNFASTSSNRTASALQLPGGPANGTTGHNIGTGSSAKLSCRTMASQWKDRVPLVVELPDSAESPQFSPESLRTSDWHFAHWRK